MSLHRLDMGTTADSSSQQHLPALIAVHDPRHHRVCICARADDKQEHEQE